jgi:hypothetical protein
MRLATAIAILCFTLVAHPQDGKREVSSEAMPLCSVIANSSKYDGKVIAVAGLYRFVIHGAILTEDLWSDGTGTLLEVVNRPPLF